MEQCHSLFESPELVELIILQLPPRDVLKVQLVAKMWRDLINRNSERMNLAKCAKPSKIELQELPSCAAVGPVYEEVLSLSPRIVYNQGLCSWTGTWADSKRNLTGFTMRSFPIWLPEGHDISLSNCDSKDFATVPRCQAVDALVIFKYTDENTDDWRWVRSTVYTRHGVTFADILFSFNAIASSLPRCAWDSALELRVGWKYEGRSYHQIKD